MRTRIIKALCAWAALLVVAACSGGAPAATTAPAASATAAATGAAATAVATGAAPTTAATAPATVVPPPATEAPVVTPTPAAATAAAGGTTFRLVLADGPRAGTWEVAAPDQGVPACSYLPDLERWVATYLGQPPLSFIDVRGEAGDPFLMFTFSDEPEELTFTPAGDVTFTADDRGDTATLTWVSEANDGAYFDSSGAKTGDAEMGEAELTIECGSVFRYT